MARNKIVGKNKRKGSNLATGRDYSYDKKYESSPAQIKRRASRNAARRRAIAARGRAALKGKDVDHVNGSPLDNRPKNLRITSKHYNRGRKNEHKRKK